MIHNGCTDKMKYGLQVRRMLDLIPRPRSFQVVFLYLLNVLPIDQNIK